MATLLQDISHAIRGLRRRPGFLIAALLTLAVGIGANVTVFSIVDALLLRPLPFGDRSDRVVTLHSTHRLQAEDWDDSELSYPDLLDVRRQASSFEGVGGFIFRNFTVTTEADAERLLGLSVTPDVFPMLGVEPMLGRTFTADEAAAARTGDVGPPHAQPLAPSLRRRPEHRRQDRHHQRSRAHGRRRHAAPLQVSRTLRALHAARDGTSRRGPREISAAIAVLKNGVSIDAGAERADAIASRLDAAYPETNRGYGIRVLAFRDSHVSRDTRLVSCTLMAASRSCS